jgi:hypothetical protein
MVSFWTPSQQLGFAKWCVAEHGHSAGYIEQLFNVMRSAFNAATEVKIRLDAVPRRNGNRESFLSKKWASS